MEKYRDGQRELHCVFVDLEKAYDRVPREELWYCMRKSGVAEKYVRVVQDMYERSRTVVRCAVGQTEEFKVEVGLHQGSALSPFLFAIVMDQLSEEVRQESPWTMMFADDIVICSESREQVEENLERWRFALERRGMKVSRSKTEYMCVNEREGSGTVRLQGEEVKKVQEFKYLGSTVQSNGECGKEVKKRVQAASSGCKVVISALGLLLLGALVSLCAVGILYHSKVVSTEILSERHDNATAKLVVLKYQATETEDDIYVNTEDCSPKLKKFKASSGCKVVISALGLLLLGALVSLCAVGILYHSKVVFAEILKERHDNATAKLMVLKYKATGLEMQAIYEDMSLESDEIDSIENYDSPTETEDDIYVNAEDCNQKLKKCTGPQAVDDDYVNSQQLHPKTKKCTASSGCKVVISALGLLLLGVLVSLCAVGILYHSKVVSTEILSERHDNATAKLMVLKYQATETERLYEELKAKHHEFVSECSKTEQLKEMLKAKYHQVHERLAACNAKQTCALCEEGWKSLGLKCYYFSTDKLNWTQGRDLCVEKGGHLVIITNQPEQEFVASQIGETHWIGLNDLETEGEWMWVNNQPLKERGVMFWYRSPQGISEHDNWKEEDPAGENCAALGDEEGFTNKWFDASCRKLKQFICEK
ncbi:hypothetical protein QTP70_034020 [Hemibagrus guttatus]|uniref:ribonuclease H n=1 Tax=Hemibagrus guttatus TaxID=175788 RepID=A0AAE0PUS8_9TELE|nr:hypothetical protein QTP70_034020 [Hemibagrus guttatus]